MNFLTIQNTLTLSKYIISFLEQKVKEKFLTLFDKKTTTLHSIVKSYKKVLM